MTTGQERALTELWSRYGVEIQNRPLDLDTVFGRHAPRHLEIGCGNGDCILALAHANPQDDFLGIEVHRSGVGCLMRRAAEMRIFNLRVLSRDAVEAVLHQLPMESFERIYVFFPDPWPKKRHQKRRLLQPGFLASLRDRLQGHGRIFIATDWQDYAEHIAVSVTAVPGLLSLAAPSLYAPRPAWRPITRYERRGLELGHTVRDFAFGRV